MGALLGNALARSGQASFVRASAWWIGRDFKSESHPCVTNSQTAPRITTRRDGWQCVLLTPENCESRPRRRAIRDPVSAKFTAKLLLCIQKRRLMLVSIRCFVAKNGFCQCIFWARRLSITDYTKDHDI